jgi:putative nucleotidyltransferase with HDIG domain
LDRSSKNLKKILTLYEIGSLINSSLEITTIQQRAMEAITKLVKCEAGSLLLLDENTNELYFQIALGEKGEKVKEIRLKVGEGIAGWVAKEGKSLIVHDVRKDPRWFRKADEKTKFKTKNMICVPVKSKGKVIGVIQAINKKRGKWNKEDLKLLEHLSNQLSIAIENARLYEELKRTFFETSQALAEAIEMRDPYTGGHTQRVMNYSIAIAEEMGLSREEIEKIRIAAILHDVGKIGIEDSILRKPSGLSDEELKKMMEHPQIGEEIVKKVSSLKEIAIIIRAHQERFDGRGYPDGLKNGEIPLPARIIAVADTFDAMVTDRPYRKGMSVNSALEELKKNKGIQFDPDVVDAFLRAFEKGMIKL